MVRTHVLLTFALSHTSVLSLRNFKRLRTWVDRRVLFASSPPDAYIKLRPACTISISKTKCLFYGIWSLAALVCVSASIPLLKVSTQETYTTWKDSREAFSPHATSANN